MGAKSREAPANLKPVGTGPYKFKDFKPGDMVMGEIYPNYHMPNRPYFDSFEMKGDEERIREGGCEAYLSKPISVAKFIETIRRFLGSA